MAGHSQFKNIMFRKGKQDKERSSSLPSCPAKSPWRPSLGMPDPAHNPRLRTAIIAAKAESVPKDNIPARQSPKPPAAMPRITMKSGMRDAAPAAWR